MPDWRARRRIQPGWTASWAVRRGTWNFPPRGLWGKAGRLSASFASVVSGRAFAAVASAASAVVVLRLVGKHLPRDEYGAVMVALTVLGYMPMLDGGFRMLLNRQMLQEADPGRRRWLAGFGQGLATRLFLGALVVGPAFMLACWAGPAGRGAGLGLGFYLALGLGGALTLSAGMQVQALVGVGRQGWMSVIQGLGSVVHLGVVAAGLRAGWGPWAFPAAVVAVAGIPWLAAGATLRSLFPGLPWVDRAWAADRRAYWLQHWPEAWTVCRMQLLIVALLAIDGLLANWLLQRGGELTVFVLVLRVLGIARGVLTSFGEALWPRVAQGREGGDDVTRRASAANAWLYGVGGGLMVGCAPAVLAWHVSPEWVASPAWVALLAARFVVVGLSSPVAYHLMGSGGFRILARRVGMEVAAAIVLGTAGAWVGGGTGLAAGLLLSTAFGTSLPLFLDHARGCGTRDGPALFLSAWARAAAGAAVAGGVGHALVRAGWTGPWSVAAALAGAGAAALGMLAWAWHRGPGAHGMARRLWQGL